MANLLAGLVADTSHVGDSNLDYARLMQQSRQFKQQQALDQDKFDYNVLTHLGSFDPTGTMYDKFGQARANKIKASLVDSWKNNPGKPRSHAIYDPKIQNEIGLLASERAQALKMDQDRVELMKQLKSDYPRLNDAKLAQMIASNQYSQEGMNPNWRESLDFNPEVLGGITDPALARGAMTKFIKDNYAGIQSRVEQDPTKGQYDYDVTAPPYMKFDPVKKTFTTPAEDIYMNGRRYPVLAQGNEQYLDKQSPDYWALRRVAEQKAAQDPNFMQFDPGIKERYVNQLVFDDINNGIKGTWKDNTKRQDDYQQQLKFQAQLAQQARGNDLAERRFAFQQMKYRDGQEEKEKGSEGTFNGIVRLATGETPTPLQQKKLESFRVKPAAFLEREIVSQLPPAIGSLYNKKDEEGKKRVVQIYDISMGTKNHFIKDPQSGAPMKVYMWTAPGGKNGVVTAKYRRKGNGEYVLADREFDSQGKVKKENGKEIILNPYRAEKANIDQLLLQYQTDFLTPKKEAAYQGDAQYLTDQTSFEE